LDIHKVAAARIAEQNAEISALKRVILELRDEREDAFITIDIQQEAYNELQDAHRAAKGQLSQALQDQAMAI